MVSSRPRIILVLVNSDQPYKSKVFDMKWKTNVRLMSLHDYNDSLDLCQVTVTDVNKQFFEANSILYQDADGLKKQT